MICGAEAPRFPPSPGESELIQSILRTWERVSERADDASISGAVVTETAAAPSTVVRSTLESFLHELEQTTDWPFEGLADLLNYGALLHAFHVVLGELTRADGGANSLLLPSETRHDDAVPTAPRFAWDLSDRERLAYQILRWTAILLENSINKHKYPSLNHVTSLVASTSERVSLEAIKVVAMLSLPPLSHRDLIDSHSQADSILTGTVTLKKRLLVVADTCGPGSLAMSMADYVDESAAKDLPTDLRVYQYYRFDNDVEDSVLVSIEVPRFTGSSDTDAWSRATFASLVEQFHVPPKHHFKLLCCVRSIAWRHHRRSRVASIVARLHSFVALFTLFEDSHDVVQYLEEHPGLVASILELVRSLDETMDGRAAIPLTVQVAALQVLTALVNDKRSRGVGVLSRQSGILAALGVGRGASPGPFVSIVRSCMSGLVFEGKAGGPTSPSDMDLAVAFVEATAPSLVAAGPFRDLSSPHDRHLSWVESVLRLICPLVGLQAGASSLTECGIVPSLLRAIASPSTSPLHTSVLVQCIQALELTLNNHSAAAVLFRELNGASILVDRLAVEVYSPHTLTDTKRVLVVSLLNMLSVSFHTQGIMSAGTAPRFIREDAVLNSVLDRVLRHVDVYGTVVYSQAATLVADIINNDPTCVHHVHSTGLADAILDTICRWDLHGLAAATNYLPPGPELIMAIPTVLSSLCISSTYVDKVAGYEPMAYLLDMFTLPSYVDEIDFLQGDVASIVATGLDELMRHVPTMARFTIEACTRALKKVAALQLCSTGAPPFTTLLRLTMHLCDVLEPVLSKVELATRFADNGGVDALFDLYGRVLPPPSMYLSSKYNESSPLPHYPTSQSITMAARAYTSQQPAAMLTKVMAHLTLQLQYVDAIRPKGAVGVVSSVVPDIPNVKEDEHGDVVRPSGEYLRLLAHVEWLVSLLVWTIRTGLTSKSPTPRWMAEFTSSQATLARLFSLDGTVQMERMQLEEQLHAVGDPDGGAGSLWKVGSLLMLKFSLMVRNLLCKYARTMATQSSSSALIDTDSVVGLESIVHVVQSNLATILTSTQRYVRHGALMYLVETITTMLFEGKRGTVVNVPLAKAFVESKVLERVVQALSIAVVDVLTSSLDGPSKQDVRLCQTGAVLLRNLADVQSLAASKSMVKMLSSEKHVDSLKVAFHAITIDAVLNIWTHPRLPHAGKVISAVVPVIATLLKQQLGKDGKSAAAGGPPTPTEMQLDPDVVSNLEMMGFTRTHVELALRQVGENDVSMAMEWLLEHPELEFVGQRLQEQAAAASPSHTDAAPTYAALRATLETVPLAIVSLPQSETVVRSLADLLVLQCSLSADDRVQIVQSFEKHILTSTSLGALTSVAHVLALVLHGDVMSRSVLLSQTSATVKQLVQVIVDQSSRCPIDEPVHECVSPTLLVLDALVQEASDADSGLDKQFKEQLVDSCASLMKRPALTASVGHALWQVVVHLTRDLDLVDRFVAMEGVEACINTPCVFDGYKELTSVILSHVLEYPEVLQARMEEKIVQSMKKLSLRLGAGGITSGSLHEPPTTRILPRNLLSELGVVAMRDEKLFLSALKETVEVKKSNSGRVYVQLKERDDLNTVGSKKLTQLPIPNASKIIALIVRRIEALWATKDAATATYLSFLVYLVTIFRVSCGAALGTEHGSFLALVVREMLPYHELVSVLATKTSTDADTPAAAAATTKQLGKNRVQQAHRLLVRLSALEGCKKIVLDVSTLLEGWTRQDYSNKTYALTCLHAWCALLMSVLWPREDKDKMWDHTKALLGKKDMVAILFEALRHLDLSHPLARSTCTMVLRPLAALTRPWVAHRLKKAQRKQSSAAAAALVASTDHAGPRDDASTRQRESSVELEDIRMSHPDDEDDVEEDDDSSDSSENDEEDEEEDGEDEDDDDDEEEEDGDEEDDEDAAAELLHPMDDDDDDVQSDNHNPLWDALDADVAVLSEDCIDGTTDSGTRTNSQHGRDDPRSLFDLFAYHHEPSGGHRHALHGRHQPPPPWSSIFREFEQDLSSGVGAFADDDDAFEGRDVNDDMENDDDDVFAMPFDVLERVNSLRLGAHRHGATASSGQTNASVAGLTHPLLAPDARRDDRPPSRHHHRQVYSMHLPSRRTVDRSWADGTDRPPSLWPHESHSHVRQVVERMENELHELLSPDVDSTVQDDASVAVQVLASTLGGSSLQTPPDTTIASSSPVDDTFQAASSEPATPPPPPIATTQQDGAPPAAVSSQSAPADASLFNFTLDLQHLSSTVPPPAPAATARTESPASTSPPLVCPDGMDPDVFHSLPPDMQAEVVAAHPPPPPPPAGASSSADGFQSSYDPETLDALPADIREEILASERREWEQARAPPPDISLAQEMDNASFVASLAPELREEILVTSDDAFLQTLPSSVRAEAMILRERAVYRAAQAQTRISQQRATMDDPAGHFFQRPRLRRMSTRHGNDFGGTTSSRRHVARRSDGRHVAASVDDASKHGLVQVDKEDAGTPDHLASISEPAIQDLFKVLHMSPSVGKHPHRVVQTVLSNCCQYPVLRAWIRTNLFHVLAGTATNRSFVPSSVIGCGTVVADRGGVFPDVMARALAVLVALTSEHVRLRVDILHTNGLGQLLELLESRDVSRNANHVDMLLEAVENVASPLSRLAPPRPPPSNESKPESDDTATEWIPVPSVVLTPAEMSHLVSVLALDMCTTSMQSRVLSILRLLSTTNRLCTLDTLVEWCARLIASAAPRKTQAAAVLPSPQDEVKLLRLLHTLSDLSETTDQFTDYVQTRLNLMPVWEALSKALEDARAVEGWSDKLDESNGPPNNAGTIIEGKSAGASCAMGALLTRFLPMIEAFFVVNARDAASMTLAPPSTDEDRTDTHATLLATFVEANRVLLNMLIREKPSLLDNSLAALIKIPRCRAFVDFDNKRTYFQASMKRLRHASMRPGGGGASVRLPVRRDRVFEDSYYALRMRSGNELRRKLHISFTGEEGIDAGGVTREWYTILAREIFNPNYALFTCAADSPTFQPNPLSFVNKEHLSYFEFVGKVIGKAIADGQLLDAHFTRSFYKHILQLPLSYSDMEAIDPEYYRNLHSILDNPIDALGLDLTFSIEHSNFGKVDVVDLVPNGRNMAVTDDNKLEYVKLVTHHRMATGIRSQIDAFLTGLHQLVSPQLISIFNENELELLISGMPEIDMDDLKANTDYANYKPTDRVIRWFWNALYAFTHEERALFIQFVTGTSKVPLEGFKALEGMRGTQKFNIHKAFGSSASLPTAHTCFNQLDLPEYESEEQLKSRLVLAIREGSEGFGFG